MIADPNASLETALRLKRTFAAPREKVFRAWTEPQKLKRWLFPVGGSTPVAEIDLRIGGKYRIGMQFPQEEIFYVSGTYQEVQPPEKLIFTWRWEKPEMDFGETLVTIEFYERGDSTEIILTHERFPNKEVCERHRQGWRDMANKLTKALARKEGL